MTAPQDASASGDRPVGSESRSGAGRTAPPDSAAGAPSGWSGRRSTWSGRRRTWSGRRSTWSGRRSTWSGLLSGLGLIAFLDETLFHQLLHWHHFYDRSTPAVGLVSDGLFHAFGFVAVVAGLFLFADLRRRAALQMRRWVGGLLIGTGGFQLYDGLVQHKLLGLHQIRYDVELLPYDLVWNLSAAALTVLGVVLVLRSTPRAGPARSPVAMPDPPADP